MNVTADDEINLKKNETIDDIWERWTCKTNTISRFVNLMFIDKV